MRVKVALATNASATKSYYFYINGLFNSKIETSKVSDLLQMNNYKYQPNQKHALMESMLYRLSSSFSYNEVYEIFLEENDITVLDEILEYFVSIQNYNACAAIKELVKEKCLKN